MKSSLVFLSLITSTASAFSNMPAFQPSETGGMASLSIKDDPMAPLGKQWTSNMDRKVTTHSHPPDEKPIVFYGEDNQANGKGGKGPLGKEWTSSMDMKMPAKANQPGGDTAVGQPRPSFQPYGLDHQANGQGGRSPLGKEWTTSMDSKPRKQGF